MAISQIELKFVKNSSFPQHTHLQVCCPGTIFQTWASLTLRSLLLWHRAKQVKILWLKLNCFDFESKNLCQDAFTHHLTQHIVET